MPLYFGLPVTCAEALRLFGLDFEDIKYETMQKNKLTENMYMDCYFVDYLTSFFKRQQMDMRIFYTDKGQCIVGYEIKEVSVFQKNFINVDHFLIQLASLKSLFSTETEKWRSNFREVVLEHLEDEPETVEFPEPYIIEFNN